MASLEKGMTHLPLRDLPPEEVRHPAVHGTLQRNSPVPLPLPLPPYPDQGRLGQALRVLELIWLTVVRQEVGECPPPAMPILGTFIPLVTVSGHVSLGSRVI